MERPLTLLMGLMVHVLVLRLMTDMLLQVDPSSRVRLSIIALSGGIGYLLRNGLSALNVQLHELPVQPVLATEYLHRQLNSNG